MMTLYKNINNIKMKSVGAVGFIHLLLLIAGVEPNPGPVDMFVFRYQYLLIEVGTFLLRKLFDVQVSNNFMQYLKTYPKCAKQLKILMDNDIITDDQKPFLPPQDNNPDTANFDITLLTCLLRNICGLKHHRDPVWQQPSNGDLSVEADITRVKECRNYVVHKGTVHISESDFNLKWKTLCQILYRLNNFCGVPNLPEMIDDAYTKPLDDQLKQQHNNILKAWHEAESLFEKGIVEIKIRQSEIKITQSKLKDGQSEIKVTQSELKGGQSKLEDGLSEIKVTQSEIKDDQSKLKDDQSEIKVAQSDLKDGQSKLKDGLSELKDGQEETKRRLDNIEQACSSNERTKLWTNEGIMQRLKKSYEKEFSTVSVTPLYSEDDRMDMLTVYTRPKMKHVPYHKTRQSEGNYKVSSYEQIFCKDNTAFRNIFVTGDAGMGKTSFCQFMALLWSKSIAGDIGGNEDKEDLHADATFMTNFDFVFYILLKETNREDVVSMIVDKYFNTSSKDKFEETIQQIEQILQTKNCLVILDGLDEWRPDICGNRNLSLPRKFPSDECTYLTTCRPYKIETDRLSENDIDHQVQITGFDHEKYIREVVGYINKSQNTNKNPDHFLKQIKECGMYRQLHIPLITSQLIVVWFNYEMTNMSKAEIYGSILEMLFERAALKNQIKFPSHVLADVHLTEPFSRFTFLKYVGTLEKVCMLSFLLLFDPDNKTPSLVFTKNQLMSEPYNISPEEVDFLCQLGVISKNKIIASFGKQEHMLSFLHNSYLEFFAALFVTLFDKTNLFCEVVKKICINDLGRYKNFLILLSGVSLDMTRLFFDIFYTVKKNELDSLRCEIFASLPDTHKPKGTISLIYCIPSFDTTRNLSQYRMIPVKHLFIIQDIILCCFKEINTPGDSKKFIRLEDFIIKYYPEEIQNLKALLVLNKHNIKSLVTEDYLDEFTEIKGLQYLTIIPRQNRSYSNKVNQMMLNNQSTLHGFMFGFFIFTLGIPVRSFSFLTSIRFKHIFIRHDALQYLMNYLSGNVLLENINLDHVRSNEPEDECMATLDLSENSKLQTVILVNVFIKCPGINTSCLTSLCLEDVYNSKLMNLENIQDSKLKYLHLDGSYFDHFEERNFINAINSLRYIEHLGLSCCTIPDSVSLQLHPDIVCDKYIYMKLYRVTMSDKCLQDIIDSVINHQSMVKVCIDDCRTSRLYSDSVKNTLQNYMKDIPNLTVPNFRYTDEGLMMIFSLTFDTIK